MTKRTTFMTRFLAMALALVLAVSNVMPGLALRASAQGPAQTAAELVAASYALSAEEVALLTSGYLKSEKYVYNHLSGREGLVTLDGNTVTAVPVDDYVPVSAELVVGNTRTPIELVNGVGTFNTEELVYNVVVTYEQTKFIDAQAQEMLLGAGASLKGGLDNLKAVYDTETNLGVVVEALPILKELTAGTFGAFEITADAVAAINSLDSELAANGGKLNLQVMNAAYDAAAAKSRYMCESGNNHMTQAYSTYEQLRAINNSNLLTNANVDLTLEALDQMNGTNNATLWSVFKGCLNTLCDDLFWASRNGLGCDLSVLADSVDYVALDALLNAITVTTPVTIQENLVVGYETVAVVSDNAETIMVNVILERIENNEWVGGVGEFGTVTVAKDATEEEKIAAIQASGLEAKLVEKIKANNPEYAVNFDHAIAGEGFFAEPGVFVIPYTPYLYTVTYAYAEPEMRPYGWEVTLPAHESASMVYDYTVNGEAKYQGEKVTVLGDLIIDRTVGKAYLTDTVYGVIGDNSENKIVNAILESGALIGDKTIRVRQPDVSDAEAMLTMVDGVLTAQNFVSANGDVWVPHTYGEKGSENVFAGNTGSWTGVEAKVIYKYEIAGYNGNEMIELAKTLKADATAQAASMNRLLAYKADLETLTRGMLGGLVGTIGVTDLTPGDNNYDDARCVELREDFTAAVRSIIQNNLDGDKLRVYGMVEKYENIGLKYYYDNAEAVRNEISNLADGLSNLTGTPEKDTAMGEVLKAVGKGDMLDKIAMLGTAMAEVKAGLSQPNAKIDLTSENLGKLMTALAMEGELDTASVTTPYIKSTVLTAKDVSAVNVQIVITVNGKNVGVASTPAATRGEVVTAAQIAAAKAEAEAIFAEAAEDKAPHYTVNVEGADLTEVADKALDQDVVVYYDYSPKAYTVQINGQYHDTVTVEDLEITLPAHDVIGYDYDYTIGDVVKNASTVDVPYTFTVADLNNLFAAGYYNIARQENSTVKDELEDAFGGATGGEEEDALTSGLDLANKTYTYVMDPNAGGVMDFAMTLINSGYSYIAFNNEPFLYIDANDALEVSLQTMINAMFADPAFGSEMLIKLGNGDLKTPLLNAKIDIGRSAEDVICDDFAFTMYLSSVPSQLTTVANGLNAVKAYMSFESNPELGQLDINLNLPEAVYEVYLTALLANNTLDKHDINAMNHAIAFNFFDDYLEELLANDNVTAQTYDNTVNMLIKEVNENAGQSIAPIDVAAYAPYYQMVRDAVNGETVELIANEDDYTVTVTAKAEDTNKALDMFGFAVPAVYASMIKELKDGNTIETKMVAYLEDAYEDYEAAVITLDTNGSKSEIANNVFDFTSDLAASAADLKAESMIFLLDDVDGNVTLSQSAILDLNGKSINGDLNFTGRKLIVMDSSLNTVSGGGITGSISGDVVILAGTYNADVSAFIRDGYYQENGAVRNALYTFQNGNLNIDTNKLFDENYVDGYLPAVHYLAAEVALDVALSYYTTSSLTIGGNDIYMISFDDIIGMVGTDSNAGKVTNIIDDVLGLIRFDGALADGNGGIDDLINAIIANLLDLDAVYAAIKNGTNVAEFTVTTGAWDVDVKHVAAGDYLTAGIVPNMERAKNATMSIKFSGSNKNKTLGAIAVLDRYLVEEETFVKLDLDQPVRDGKILKVAGGAQAALSIDLSSNCDYNRMLAALVAFSSEELTMKMVKNGCIMELNEAMSLITVGDFFTAIANAVNNAEFNFAAMAAKANVSLTDSQLAKLTAAYDEFQSGVGKVLAKVGLTENSRTPLADLAVNGTLHYDADVQEHSADATYRGYGVQVDLKYSSVSLKIKFAQECNGLWGDANRDGRVNYKDAILILQWATGRIAAEQRFDRIHLCVCDVNGDGNINYKDAVLVLQRGTGRITKFPVEA